MTNHYAALGVGLGATPDQIRAAYRAKARETHPDRGGSAETFGRVQAAYRLLRQPRERAQYDRELRAWLAAHGGVLCPVCGEANRTPPEEVRSCATCDHDLPTRPRTASDRAAQVTDRIRDRASVLSDAAGERLAGVGDRLVAELGDLLSDGLDKGIGAVRRRLGLERRQR